MAFRKYTQCYVYKDGDKPFHEGQLLNLGIVQGGLPAVLWGALTGLVLGLLAGPVGAVVGALSGIVVGIANALTQAANEWRYHRLICLPDANTTKCAIGSVAEPERIGDLGQFDNDEFFDLSLMPHPASTAAAEVYGDGWQGTELMKPILNNDAVYGEPLRYDQSRSWLHCEAEGDFWARVSDLAPALGLLVTVLVAATAAAVAGGAAAGCAIGVWFFGPVGCAVGALIGGLLGATAAGAAAGFASYALVRAALQAVFDVDPGDIEDANVGDRPLGPLRPGERLIVFGEHVYDGFHEGWHEIHPLMAVLKVEATDTRQYDAKEHELYVEQNKVLSGQVITFGDHTALDPAFKALTADQVARGLADPAFKAWREALRERWCRLVGQAFDDSVHNVQQGLDQRWAVHPAVDGCAPDPAIPPIH